MPERLFHKSLHLQNFTVFKDAQFEFSPGVNAIIGENGTGKTHLLKAMYAFQRPVSRDIPDINSTLKLLFQIGNINNIMRSPVGGNTETDVSGVYGDKPWTYRIVDSSLSMMLNSNIELGMSQPVFVPAMDMMGHTKGFQEAYNRVFLDFDLTCYDIVNLFNLKSRDVGNGYHTGTLSKLLGGEIVNDGAGRFFLKTSTGRFEMPMVAEGHRKIASLVRLQDNNWLTPGTTLYWDEPESNINPILMEAIVESVLSMARAGVQVFLTTHSYVILKELDLQATPEDQVRFFSLHGNKKLGTQVTSAEELSGLVPNPILDEYASLYDRDLDRALGKGRKRAAV